MIDYNLKNLAKLTDSQDHSLMVDYAMLEKCLLMAKLSDICR